MDKKVLVYVVLTLIVIITGFAVVMYKQKCAGLGTGTPSQLSQGKNMEIEKNVKAKWGRSASFGEDAG